MLRFNTFIAAGIVFSPSAAAFDHGDWLEDFEQLKTAITWNYPNLEWAAERGLDLAAVERRARDRLAAATTDFEARLALERFLGNFADGHLSLTWSAPQPPGQIDPPATVSCKSMGYEESRDTDAIARNLSGYQPLPSANGIDAGTLAIAGKKVAVLRISLFYPSLAMCEVAWQEIRQTKSSCDAACESEIEQRSNNLFLSAIEGRLGELVKKRPDMLLVDLAGNGGGNATAIAVARMLGSRNLSVPPMAFVRNADRERDLAENAAALESALRNATKAEAAFLRPLLASLNDAREDASHRCDLKALWSGKAVTCTNLVRGPFFAGGMVAQELPEEFRGEPWASQVSATSQFLYSPGLWTAPVVVLVDGNSGSASELFVAMLRDAGRATIIGAPTAGAGCGWTLPRQNTELTHSGGRLQMPDCARFRRDGSNELDGIQPDKLVGFRRYDSPKQQVARLTPKLREVVSEVATGKH